MSTLEPSADNFASALTKSVHDHWGVFLTEGVILTLLGFGAILVPPIAGLATTIFLGWLLLVAGAVSLVATFRARHAPGFEWAILSAIAAIVAGALLLWNPFVGIVTLTFVLIAYFIVDGALMIALALSHRSELSGRWQWMLANGVVDLILAAIIVSGLPGTLVWALGLLVGIDMIFGGTALIAMAMQAHATAPAPAVPASP